MITIHYSMDLFVNVSLTKNQSKQPEMSFKSKLSTRHVTFFDCDKNKLNYIFFLQKSCSLQKIVVNFADATITDMKIDVFLFLSLEKLN